MEGFRENKLMAGIVVMGNKNLAVGCTAHLLGLGEYPVAVILNPDDDGKDRHGYLSLKRFGKGQSLTLYQPNDANKPSFIDSLKSFSPSFVFSFSYSRLLKKAFLDHFPERVFNIHFSLLPKNRGCLPLIYALSEGDTEAGVTLHLIDEGIDTGDIVSQSKISISTADTARTLYFRATAAGIALFAETLPKILEGTYSRVPQAHKGATYHPQVNPNDRWINWNWSEKKIHAFIRAHTFLPYPGARFLFDDKHMEVRWKNGKCKVEDTKMTYEEFIHAYRQPCSCG